MVPGDTFFDVDGGDVVPIIGGISEGGGAVLCVEKSAWIPGSEKPPLGNSIEASPLMLQTG
jgi:hypothetical protein